MPTFTKYESYKDSGVEWIGKIPSHWSIKSIRSVTDFKSERNRPDLPILSVYREYGVLPKDSRDDNHNATSLDISNYKVVEVGDLVVNKMKAWQGSMGISEHQGIVSPAYITCRVDASKISPKLLHYLLRSKPYIGVYNTLSYGVRIGQWDMHYEDFKKISLPIPDIEEQRRIAEFLDCTTTDIDRAIAQKQRMIELLQEQKAILINQAVTKGLNPNVPMRDSGIEWLGEIPEHWSIKRAKHISSIFVPQRNKPELNSSVGIPWITTEDLTANAVSKSNSGYFVSPHHAKQAGSRVLPENSVIASCVGTFGVASVNTQPVIINQQLQAFIPKRINSWYLRYAISISKTYFELNSTSTTLAYVNQEGFSEIPLPCPPEAEQKEIVDFLDGKLIEIDGVIQIVEQQVRSIQNFRQILISQAITGKLKV